MKVLICCSELPPISGGVQQVTLETAKRLAHFPDTEVHIITLGYKKDEIRDGIIIHYIPKKPLLTLYYSTLGFKLIKNLLEKEHFDLIHIHMLLPWAYIFRNEKCKKILTCHGNDIYKTKWYQYYFTKIGMNNTNRITSVSKNFVNFLKKNWNITAKYISNGIDLNNFYPVNIKKEENSILFVGRYIKSKGILNLIEVSKYLKEYKFYFVGSGPLNKNIKGPNIINLGFKQSSELAEIYSKCEISVFPSDYESFGLTALESIACGTPVIVTPLGFSDFIVNNKNGLIIDNNNSYNIKKAIIKLSSNKELLNKFSKEGIKTAKNLSWDKITREYYNIYYKVLND